MQGVPRLGAHLDPMGGEVSCRKRKVSWRRVPEDIGWALGIPPADSVCAVKCHWSVNGEPAAISTTYLTADAASQIDEPADERDRVMADYELSGFAGGDPARARAALGTPAALHMEMQPPPSSIARGLRLGAGQPAAMITVRFDDEVTGRAVALTVAALRADMFRIVIDSPADTAPVRNITAHALPDDLGPGGWPRDDPVRWSRVAASDGREASRPTARPPPASSTAPAGRLHRSGHAAPMAGLSCAIVPPYLTGSAAQRAPRRDTPGPRSRQPRRA